MEFVEKVDMKPADERYLNFLRVDKFDLEKSFDEIEMDGILFYANADVLSGLCSWAYFDNNSEDAVLVPFGSGCSSIISMAIRKNWLNGDSVFLGGFDPSVRVHFGENELSFVVPRSRFKTMKDTMMECCLSGTKAWRKVKDRIENSK